MLESHHHITSLFDCQCTNRSPFWCGHCPGTGLARVCIASAFLPKIFSAFAQMVHSVDFLTPVAQMMPHPFCSMYITSTYQVSGQKEERIFSLPYFHQHHYLPGTAKVVMHLPVTKMARFNPSLVSCVLWPTR